MANQHYTTEEAAAALKIKPQTLRAALVRTGGYFGVMPMKAPNGRLRWPAKKIDELATGPADQE